MLMDFSVEVDQELQRSEYLPPELLVAMVQFKMGMTFSWREPWGPLPKAEIRGLKSAI